MRAFLVLLGAAVALCGCAVPRRVAVLPPESDGYVAVLSGEMPGALSQVARHSWIVANVPGKGLRRFELQHSGSGAFSYFGEGEVAVHGVVHYPPGELERVIDCLEREEARYHERYRHYVPIPGPNSNTIVDFLLRHCGVHVELPATAIGRDYRGLIGATVTSRGTGVQLETWPLGVKLGVEEGVEVHLFDLPLGVHFWPPGLTVPVNPGRIGFDDDLHHEAEPREDGDPREQRRFEREYGLVSLWMGARYARTLEPERTRGVSDLGTVGISGRSGYGSSMGYGLGFDLDAGVAAPLGFAYAARLYPAGALLMLGDNSYFGVFTGVGSNGVTGSVPARLELPSELRFELDLARYVRFGARANIGWYPGSNGRRGGSLVSPFADELLLGAFLRLGEAERCACRAHMGRGYFIAVERGELMRSVWLGASFGIEADFGG